MHAEKKEERKGPKVGEVWGNNDPFTWHLVEVANDWSVVSWTFRGPNLKRVEQWNEWAADKHVICGEHQPKETGDE